MASFYSPSTGGLYRSDTYDFSAPTIGLVPADSIYIADDLYSSLISGLKNGEIISLVNNVPTLISPPAPSIQLQIAINESAIQSALDAMAQKRGYSDIKSACAYASSTPLVPSINPNFAQCEKFRIEGNALQAWMALTWAEAYSYLSTVESGTNIMPTSTQAVSMMPSFTWPD